MVKLKRLMSRYVNLATNFHLLLTSVPRFYRISGGQLIQRQHLRSRSAKSTPAVRLKITEMYSPAQITDTDPPASDQSPCNTHTLTTIPSTFSHQDRTGLAAAASGLSTKFGYTANFNLDNPLTHVCPYNLTTGKRCPAGSDCGFQRICCKRTKSPAMIAEHIAEVSFPLKAPSRSLLICEIRTAAKCPRNGTFARPARE